MAEKPLENVRVAVLATEGFEESELLEPKKALEEAGAHLVVVAPKSGSIYGMRHHDKGASVTVDLPLDEADPDDFDALLLPGGALNADALRVEPKAQEFVKAIDEAHKPLAAICHAPWLLASARLTGGRRMTSYHTIQDDLRNAGGRWTDAAVVADDNWVTSREPKDIPRFNAAMIKLFAENRGGPRAK
jgi:protease I